MKTQRLALLLTAVNLVLLFYSLVQAGPSTAQTPAPTLRARVFELVDDRGVVRTRLNVESSGEVVLRMTDKNGTIRVKLGAGVDGSGLLLADETAEVGAHILARRTGTAERPNTTSITLAGANGRRRVITP
ncbi:MAG TPA: hypothetical protein VFT63_06955 [bacterium]|nr:hypothetical protein [bacterium]